MVFYIRSENVPELAGLSKWDRRVMLRGTFMKERALSTLVLLGVMLLTVNYLFNPLLQSLAPQVRNNSLPYVAVLLAWLFLMMWIRDVVVMNLLRPKIAARRAALAAQQLPSESETAT